MELKFIYYYKYETRRIGKAALPRIATRADAITFYCGSNFDERVELLSKFGKYRTGGGCINIQKLQDIDTDILIKIVKNSIEHRKTEYLC